MATAAARRPGLEAPDSAARAPLPVEEPSVLFEALQDLPPAQRRTVVLRHWLGPSFAETARELGVSEGTVKSNSSRWLAKLQEALGTEHRA